MKTGIGGVKHDNIGLIAVQSGSHARIPEGIPGRVQGFLARSGKNHAAGLGWNTPLPVVARRGFALAVQGIRSVQRDLPETDARFRKSRDSGEAQSPHVRSLFFALDKDGNVPGNGLAGRFVKMIEVVHMGDHDRVHSHDGLNGQRQGHKGIRTFIVGRRHGWKRAPVRQKGIQQKLLSGKGNNACGVADLLKNHALILAFSWLMNTIAFRLIADSFRTIHIFRARTHFFGI